MKIHIEYPLDWDRDDDENGNVEHIWRRHKIYKWQVDDVVFEDEEHVARPNKKKYGGVTIMGRDRGGKYIIVILESKDKKRGIWRPKTAREAN